MTDPKTLAARIAATLAQREAEGIPPNVTEAIRLFSAFATSVGQTLDDAGLIPAAPAPAPAPAEPT